MKKLSVFRKTGMLKGMTTDHIAVKAPVFPFSRFPGVDPLLGPRDEIHRRGDWT